jgi:CRP-like cAMP-binding protein
VLELDEVSLEPGQVLIRKGDPGDALFIVRTGKLQTEAAGRNGISVLERVVPGRAIGEVALLSGEPRMATVRAVESAKLWRPSRQKLDALKMKHSSFAFELFSSYRSCCNKIR